VRGFGQISSFYTGYESRRQVALYGPGRSMKKDDRRHVTFPAPGEKPPKTEEAEQDR